jgi:hypothetical protein
VESIDEIDRWNELQTSFAVLNLNEVVEDAIASLISVLAMVLSVGTVLVLLLKRDAGFCVVVEIPRSPAIAMMSNCV